VIRAMDGSPPMEQFQRPGQAGRLAQALGHSPPSGEQANGFIPFWEKQSSAEGPGSQAVEVKMDEMDESALCEGAVVLRGAKSGW